MGIMPAMRIAFAIVVMGCAGPAAAPKLPVAEPPAATPTPVATAPAPPAGIAYPTAPAGSVVEIHHGVAIADPYRWLEDMASPATHQWVAAENALADGYLAKLPGRDKLHARIAQLISYERYGVPYQRGAHYFWTHNDGTQSQSTLWTAASPSATPRLLLDPNAISTDGSQAFAGISVTEAGDRIAYGLAIGGGDWQHWHVRDVATGKDLPDQLEHIKYYAPVFTRDGKALYYSRFPAPAPGKELTETDHDCKIYFHKLGTDPARDAVVYERPDHPTWQFELSLSRDGRYLVIATGDGQVGDRNVELISYVDAATPGARPIALIDQYEAEYLFIGSAGPLLYFQTSLDAANKKIIAIDIHHPARDQWKQIVPAGDRAIESARMAGAQLFVTTLQDAHHAVAAYDLRGKKLRDVALPGLGSAYGFGGRPEAREAFYWFSSFTVPGAIYRYELATGKSSLWKQPRVPFDPSQFETRQVVFPSKDGTKVPMFVTAKSGLALDGSHPTVMTAYGFGGISLTPYFDPPMIAWLEHGGVTVTVNIRGGGEYGEPWHLAAKGAHRQVGWNDFIAAGEALIAGKLTSAAHLGAIGTSGGGMLVGGVLMQRPDLFGAVVPIAGVHDLLRFQLFGQGAGWQGDLGAPDEAADFPTLRALSPLHNVRPGTRYPATFIITSDHDVRVPPLHSYKLAATMQAAQAGPAPVIMRVQTQSGHGGGSTLAQEIEQQTEILGFLAANLGLSID
jgi:prolyl oligopeptidase